jgi:AcrR family transcriptional regulator
MDRRRSKSRLSSLSRFVDSRERIDAAAYTLFSKHGVRAVGVNEIVARSGVAKRTLYKHYPSKDELALAFLRRREQLWTRSWLQREVERRALPPGEKLLVIFDIFDKWFRRADFEACSFARALLEHHDRAHPVREAAVHHIETITLFIKHLAENAGVRDADGFARQWQMLMMGCIIAAYGGDLDAAKRAKKAALLLLSGEGMTGHGA